MMNATDYDLKGWCASNGLPWSASLADGLDKWGVTCVEHIKLLPREEFLSIFENEKFIVKETAKIVFDKLHETPFDLSRAAVKREGYASPITAAAPLGENIPQLNMTNRLGALLAIDQAKQQGSNSSRDRKALGAAQQLESVARMWNFKGHQSNFVRLAVAEILQMGYTKTDITKVIRVHSAEEWDGTVNNGNDKTCKRIMATLVRIHKMAKSGQLDNVSPSTSKTLVKGSRGAKLGVKRGPYKKRQSIDAQSILEDQEAANAEAINAIVEADALAPLDQTSIEVNDIVEGEQYHEKEVQEQHVQSI